MRAFIAFSSILSSAWKSMARLVLPSRLELKRPEGSCNEAPLAKVIFTTFVYVSPVQIIPACDQTGTPLHFHSSTRSRGRSRSGPRAALRDPMDDRVAATVPGRRASVPSYRNEGGQAIRRGLLEVV